MGNLLLVVLLIAGCVINMKMSIAINDYLRVNSLDSSIHLPMHIDLYLTINVIGICVVMMLIIRLIAVHLKAVEACHDELTKLLNRKEGLKTLEQHMRRYHVAKCLVFIDIDGLKQVNDMFGHAIGDKVIVRICNQISRNLSHKDVFFRLGGDEFVLLLVGNSYRDTEEMITDILRQLEHYEGDEYKYRFSYGIVELQENEQDDVEDLIIQSDHKMYLHKNRANK